jgi:hypothetical protein
MITRLQARRKLKDLRHSYRSAADALGYSHLHFALVMIGKRQSQTLLKAIETLTSRENVPVNSPYRKAGA